MYFKDELKHSKRFDHVTDNVMSLFWSWKNYQVEHYFPLNVLGRVTKLKVYSLQPSAYSPEYFAHGNHPP